MEQEQCKQCKKLLDDDNTMKCDWCCEDCCEDCIESHDGNYQQYRSEIECCWLCPECSKDAHPCASSECGKVGDKTGDSIPTEEEDGEFYCSPECAAADHTCGDCGEIGGDLIRGSNSHPTYKRDSGKFAGMQDFRYILCQACQQLRQEQD